MWAWWPGWCNAPGLSLLVFIVIIAISALGFVRHPTGFLPNDDQGYAVVISKLPVGAAQPRVRAVTRQLSEIIKKTKGIAAWVTFGGYSLLDAANVSNISTTFIVYDDWEQAWGRPEPGQYSRQAPRRGGQSRGCGDIRHGAAAHPGAGPVGRLSNDGRGPGKVSAWRNSKRPSPKLFRPRVPSPDCAI